MPICSVPIPHLSFEDYYRFMHRVRATQDRSECWEWEGTYGAGGYGLLKVSKQEVLAHRLSVLIDGRDPSGQVVRHTCDNTRCVNPGHLVVGTQAQNVTDREQRADMTARNSAVQRLGMSKRQLTMKQAKEIRARHAAGGVSVAALCREFGVGRGVVDPLVRGLTYRDSDVAR